MSDLEEARECLFAAGGQESDLEPRDDPAWYWRRAAKLWQDKASTKLESKEVILQPQEFDVEVAGKNGIRVRGTSLHDCVIEFKDGDAWKPLKYVQGIYIELDVNNPLPKVQVSYIVVP